ncbi:MAG: hypothetical protein U5O39_03895 [Gammaproteobacteria bacterium]|nr:hypothetical protein [Gammaproteobacteria bacterium]
MRNRLSREEALSFLLTHLVVEREYTFDMNQTSLFRIMNLAAEAESRISEEEGLIPHELIEQLATRFIEQ